MRLASIFAGFLVSFVTFNSMAYDSSAEMEIFDLRGMASGEGLPKNDTFYNQDHTDDWYREAWVYYGKYVIHPIFHRETPEPYDKNAATGACVGFVGSQRAIARASLGFDNGLLGQPIPSSDQSGKWEIDANGMESIYKKHPAYAALIGYSPAVWNAYINVCAANPAGYLSNWN